METQEFKDKLNEASNNMAESRDALVGAINEMMPPALQMLNDNLAQMVSELATMRRYFKQMVEYSKPTEPGYIYPLNDYPDFDWSTIGATVIQRDGKGYVSMVEWGGYFWKRRSKSDNKGAAVWFNRTYNPYDTDAWEYVRLVTFRNTGNPEPLQFPMSRPSRPEVDHNPYSPPANPPSSPFKPSIPDDVKQTQDKLSGMVNDVALRAQALAATSAHEFDALVANIYPIMEKSESTANTCRVGVTYTPNYNHELNKAYLAGIDAYIDEYKYQMSRGKDKVVAHKQAKIKGHRAFKREMGS